MRRSEINRVLQRAEAAFARHHWTLPPEPRWDVTDFGLGDFRRFGLTLVNLASEPEYCEKLMYAERDQTTPVHAHRQKKEDIICRVGRLCIQVWAQRPETAVSAGEPFMAPINGRPTRVPAGSPVVLEAGWRITLVPGVWHAFAPASDSCIIGEVSTANDDLHDNFFLDPLIGRYPGIEEDEPPLARLISE